MNDVDRMYEYYDVEQPMKELVQIDLSVLRLAEIMTTAYGDVTDAEAAQLAAEDIAKAMTTLLVLIGTDDTISVMEMAASVAEKLVIAMSVMDAK